MTTIVAVEERIRRAAAAEGFVELTWAPMPSVAIELPPGWEDALTATGSAAAALASIWAPVAGLVPRSARAVSERVQRIGLLRTRRHPVSLVYLFRLRYWFAWRGLPPAAAVPSLGRAGAGELAFWSLLHDGFESLEPYAKGALPSARWRRIEGLRASRRLDPARALEVATGDRSLIVDATAAPPAVARGTKWKVDAWYGSLGEGLDDALGRELEVYGKRKDARAAPAKRRAPGNAAVRPHADVMSALVAAVYERPDDDEPRRVLADALLDRGDARGELIQLQCDRAAGQLRKGGRAREEALIGSLGPKLLGPLREMISAPRFERGFLAACNVAAVEPRRIGDPAWATVRAIAFTGLVQGVTELVTHPVMRALRAVELPEDGLEVFESLYRHEPPVPLERLRLVIPWREPLDRLRALADADPGLPALRELELCPSFRGFDPLDPRLQFLVGTRLWKRLEQVTIACGAEQLAVWLEAARASERPCLTLIEPFPPGAGWALKLAREGDRCAVSARWLARTGGIPLEQLARAFGAARRGTLSRVTIEPSRPLARDAAYERAVEKELRRLRVPDVKLAWKL